MHAATTKLEINRNAICSVRTILVIKKYVRQTIKNGTKAIIASILLAENKTERMSATINSTIGKSKTVERIFTFFSKNICTPRAKMERSVARVRRICFGSTKYSVVKVIKNNGSSRKTKAHVYCKAEVIYKEICRADGMII